MSLIRAMLKGMIETAVAESLYAEEKRINNLFMFAASSDDNLPDANDVSQPVHASKVKKCSGGYLSISYDHWKPEYRDEYTGEILKHELVQDAMRDELDDFNEHVWKVDTLDHAKTIPDYILNRSRWVLSNKGDEENADVRARLVG